MAGILNAIEIASQGLSVQRAKMNTVAENIANAETTETEQGGPYRRQRVIVKSDKKKGAFSTLMNDARLRLACTNERHIKGKPLPTSRGIELSSVKMKTVTDPASSYRLVYDPTHPQADKDGYVKMPDVEIVTEMVDMMAASRAYEANTVVISTAKQMAKDALDI
ncbi:MAG: flagellar basal body rod protein FlgC [Candidatus Zixiibacteriota bacterium]